MPNTFQQVPNWQSWENQGAGVAVADLDGDGRPEMLVLRVDHPTPGPNVAFYRVGNALDAGGNVAAWGPWIPIPGWTANENQGAGLAIADLDNDGRPELIVFQVSQQVPGPNSGRFSVGRKLDATGNVTAGWSAWQEVPDWQSFDNQGGAIAVADLDGDGKAELIVLRVDNFHANNPTRPNRAFYRVGTALQATGQIGGTWGPWMEVDWFSWFNQGAGIAIADLDNNGRPELIVFQIDNPPGANGGFVRIGWNLDKGGKVSDGWGAWAPIDGWDSWEDQGGGIALASFGAAAPSVVVLHVDNPPGLNAGLFSVVPLTLDIDLAPQKGLWRLLPYLSQVLPVHAAMLHTNKVLFFAGSGNNAFRSTSPDFGNEADQIYTTVVWDFVNNTFDHPPTLRGGPNGRPIDYFCCGHCFLPDGRVLVAGGTDQYDTLIQNHQMVPATHGFLGLRDAMIFDPQGETWKLIAPMAGGRWYPTLVMLSDGRVIACSGLDDQQGLANNTLEIIKNPDTNAWTKARDFNLPLYPHLFLLQDGRFFFTGGKMDTPGDSVPFRFDPLLPTAAELVPGLRDVGRRNQCASVILPPVQAQKIMILGGGPEDETEATDNVDIIDFSQGAPTYQPAARLNFDRMHVNAVLLPDRTVLAVGGGGIREAGLRRVDVPQLVKERLVPERFDASLDPAGTWTQLAAAQVPRLYHSVALLLPDGRVVSACGNPDKGTQVNWLPPDAMEEMRIEIFSPPYLFNGPRPQIAAAPANLTYGEVFTIASPQAAQIKWISLIRAGLTTHSFNCEQRLVDVPFGLTAAGLQGTLTGEPNLAPPGWYMLFLTDTAGIPSVATWIQVG